MPRRYLAPLVVLSLLMVTLAPSVLLAQVAEAPVVVGVSEPSSGRTGPAAGDGVLRVLTLNLAHGRSTGPHQLLRPPRHHERTLERIAALLEREAADVVALQEADGPSYWSGNFSHVRRLATLAGYPFALHGQHVATGQLKYGTALLSGREPTDPLAVTFTPTPPTHAKGFTLATVPLGATTVDVVSVHLDFSGAEARARQVRQLVAVLEQRRGPLVVMGDFNSRWRGPQSAVRALAETLGLNTWEPEARAKPKEATFPGSGARIDWILVSADLDFVRYEVLSDVVSDHRALVAELRLR